MSEQTMTEGQAVEAIEACQTIEELNAINIDGATEAITAAIAKRTAELAPETPAVVASVVDADAPDEPHIEIVAPTQADKDLAVLVEAQQIRQDPARFRAAKSIAGSSVIQG